MVVGRFAPSPSGRMHLGNIYSAVLSWLSARSQGGRWILRIEDLDRQRCHPEYADQIEDDLRWLGLDWDEGGSLGGPNGPYYQSERTDFYINVLDKLRETSRLYPCFCSRADIMASSAPHQSDGVVVYSGRCRTLSAAERMALSAERKPATRLCVPDADCTFNDGHYGLQHYNLARDCGDFIVRRADGNFAYQLAVVTDDALMGVTEVVRGCDLLSSTPQQIYLYGLLGYTAPQFAHIPLLVTPDGRRLAKRNAGTDMGSLRQRYTPQQLLGLIAHLANLTDGCEELSISEFLSLFAWNKVPTDNIVVD